MRLILCLGVVFLTGPALANPTPSNPTKPTVPSIVEKAKAPVRVAPSGKARIRILAQGDKSFLGELWLAPNAKVPIHQDPTEEYLHIVSGSGQISIDGKTTSVGEGSTIYMPANAKVQFKNGPKPLVCIQVFSGPQSAQKYMKWPIAQ